MEGGGGGCKSLKAVNRPGPQPRQHVIIELSMLMVMTKPQTPGMPGCLAHPGLSLAPGSDPRESHPMYGRQR